MFRSEEKSAEKGPAGQKQVLSPERKIISEREETYEIEKSNICRYCGIYKFFKDYNFQIF